MLLIGVDSSKNGVTSGYNADVLLLVTFNPKTPSDVSCTNDGGVYRCVSSGDGYDDATYNLIPLSFFSFANLN